MRILHTMLRVVDLERSIAFYTTILGMRLLRKTDYKGGRFTLAFLGFNEEPEGAVIELTHNWDISNYQLGDAFGHIAIEVDDVYKSCALIRQRGGNIVRDAGPMAGSSTILAFVKDPDDYMIELLSPHKID